MDETYDVIVCGTGLVECVLSGLLSVSGYKVLHVDRNPYYGGESASLDLDNLYKKFGKQPPSESMGKSHLYCVDLIPKVLMCAGELVRILRATVIERYSMEFMLIHSSFVMKNGKMAKVPSTPKEALSSPLMGMFEKPKVARFLGYINRYDPKDPSTFEKMNLQVMTTKELFDAYGIKESSAMFIGHSVALHTTDEYLQKPALDTVMRCKLYADSVQMYQKSPYVYPLYGNGELPQAFSRLCAVFGGTYMLQTPVEKVHFDENGKFTAIECGGKKAYGKYVVGDPSYFPDRVIPTGMVIRCIAIMDHGIPGVASDVDSCQIIIPHSELKRKNDMYILQLTEANKVCPEGKYVVIIGTVVEDMTDPENDIKPGLQLIGKTLETFVSISTISEPQDDGSASNCFISKSYDATTHFEASAADILSLFNRINGAPYDFSLLEKAGKHGME